MLHASGVRVKILAALRTESVLNYHGRRWAGRVLSAHAATPAVRSLAQAPAAVRRLVDPACHGGTMASAARL